MAALTIRKWCEVPNENAAPHDEGDAQNPSTTSESLSKKSEIVKEPATRPEFSSKRTGAAEVVRNPQDNAIAGIVVRMPAPDGRVFLCSYRTRRGIFWRSAEIAFDLPVLALAEERGCGWVRVELNDQRGQRGWEIDLPTLLDGRRFTMNGRQQVALPFAVWFFRNLEILDREQQLATYGSVLRSRRGRPA